MLGGQRQLGNITEPGLFTDSMCYRRWSKRHPFLEKSFVVAMTKVQDSDKGHIYTLDGANESREHVLFLCLSLLLYLLIPRKRCIDSRRF